jgi:hypothetical protein
MKSVRRFYNSFGRTQKVILLVSGLFFSCGCLLFLFYAGLIAFLGIKAASSPKNNLPHYGVFLNQSGKLIELSEKKFFNTPLQGELNYLETISNPAPILIVWRQDVNLDYLDLYKLGKYTGEKKRMKYNSLPQKNGSYVINPSTPLADGEYCLIQGDPLGTTLPGWCFKISSTGGNSSNSGSAKPIIEGSITIPRPLGADLDTGKVPDSSGKATVDIWFRDMSDGEYYLTTLNGAQIGLVGKKSIGLAGCKTALLSEDPINIKIISPGDFICLKTSLGNYSEIEVRSVQSTRIAIDYATWVDK